MLDNVDIALEVVAGSVRVGDFSISCFGLKKKQVSDLVCLLLCCFYRSFLTLFLSNHPSKGSLVLLLEPSELFLSHYLGAF